MKYLAEIRKTRDDPRRLEDLYQSARQRNEAGEFAADLQVCYGEAPQELLYAAWHFRLQSAAPEAPAAEGVNPNWLAAVPLTILTGLILWAISDTSWMVLNHIPYIILLWSPIAGLAVMAYLALAGRRHYRRTLLLCGGLIAAAAYVLLLAPGQSSTFRNYYLDLMALHLPLLAWIAAGASLKLGDYRDRFAFMIKSIEVFVTGGLFIIAGVIFAVITVGMFQALSITLPDILMRLIVAGGSGLIPVIAVAVVYDPQASPAAQSFGQGLNKLVSMLPRLLLPLSLVVLVVYLFVIPFNFMQPFTNRDVLIFYNAMLFAIMGLLIGATPLSTEDLSLRTQSLLRNGILLLAGLTILVSVYALSATVFRTIQGGMTINRLTIIGWNGINIGILVLLIYRQIRAGRQAWVEALQRTFSAGTLGYLAWTLVVIVAIPLFFR